MKRPMIGLGVMVLSVSPFERKLRRTGLVPLPEYFSKTCGGTGNSIVGCVRGAAGIGAAVEAVAGVLVFIS
eukprot:scaffold7179_cov72-Cyclotella_meneghiniana.AAC.9